MKYLVFKSVPSMRLTLLIWIVITICLILTGCGKSDTKNIPVMVKPLVQQYTNLVACPNQIAYYSEKELTVLSEGDTIVFGENQAVVQKIGQKE